MISPLATGHNGRGADGRFVANNHCGKGNPLNRKVARLRSALLGAVSPNDLRQIIAKLIEKAIAGDVVAAREVLDRTLGRPLECDLLERLGELEQVLKI